MNIRFLLQSSRFLNDALIIALNLALQFRDLGHNVCYSLTKGSKLHPFIKRYFDQLQIKEDSYGSYADLNLHIGTKIPKDILLGRSNIYIPTTIDDIQWLQNHSKLFDKVIVPYKALRDLIPSDNIHVILFGIEESENLDKPSLLDSNGIYVAIEGSKFLNEYVLDCIRLYARKIVIYDDYPIHVKLLRKDIQQIISYYRIIK